MKSNVYRKKSYYITIMKNGYINLLDGGGSSRPVNREQEESDLEYYYED